MNVLNIFADFETRNNEANNQGLIDIATISYLKNNKIVSKEFTNLNNSDHIVKQLLDYIVNLKKSELNRIDYRNKNHIIIYFHNGANYDNFFIIDYLLENGYNQTLRNEPLENEFVLVASDSVKLLNITLFYKGCLIHFKDSYKKLTYPIHKIGELVNQNKLVELGEKYYGKNFYELNKNEQEEYLKYAIFDTQIALKGMQYFAKFLSDSVTANNLPINKIKNIDHWNNFTLSQAAKNIYETLEWNKRDYLNLEPNLYDNYLYHYKGGYTYCNHKHLNKIVENVNVYDINSSYPAIMLEKIACEVIDEAKYNKLADADRAKLLTVYIIKAKVKDGYPPIIRKMKSDTGNLDKYIENRWLNPETNKFFEEINEPFLFPFFFWAEEFEYVKMFYEIEYFVFEEQYFKKHFLFNRYINYFKEQKEKADRLKLTEKDELKLKQIELIRNFAKLSMNCLSGKFGQKIKNENWYAVNYELKPGVYEIDDKLVHIIKEKEPLSRNSHLYKFAYLDTNFKRYINQKIPNNYIISYITAIGRCKLFEVIAKLKNDFVYCDTDSIYCVNQTLPNELIDSAKFGFWKFEGNWKYFKCLKPKCYLATNSYDLKNINWKDKNLVKVTISGFTQMLFLNELNTLDDFKLGLESVEDTVKKGAFGGKVWEKRKKIL